MRKIAILLFGLAPAALFGQTTPSNTAGFTIGVNRAGITLAQAQDAAGDSVAVERAARIAQDAIHSAAILALDTSGTVAYADTARRAFTSAKNDSIRVDSLYTKIRPDSSCVVDLNFSRATYSGGVWTIPNDANKAAPAYMYGGLPWGAAGSDSSGVSRDGLTGRVTANFKGSAADSLVTASNSAIILDSTDNFTIAFRYKTKILPPVLGVIFATRLDTGYANVASNQGISIEQKQDSVLLYQRTPSNGSHSSSPRKKVLPRGEWVHFIIVRQGNSRVLYVNGDSVAGFSTTSNTRQTNRIYLGGLCTSTSFHVAGAFDGFKLYRRALTSAERLTLYNNSLRGIQPPGPSMGEVQQSVTDTASALRLIIADAAMDSTLYIWVTAGDTTSPGCFYAPDTSTGKFVRADSALLRRARIVGVAIDSVNKDGTVRIQTAGTVSFSWWNGLLGPAGSTVVNDSIAACNPAPSDATRTNTLPMQALGIVLDSITVRLDFGEVWYYEN